MSEIKCPARVIFDLGANMGQNIPYYLLKSDLVVAVEANPTLNRVIRGKFVNEIAAGKLIVENVVLIAGESKPDVTSVDFFLNKQSHVLSQIDIPKKNLDLFEKVELPCINVSNLIKSHLGEDRIFLYCKVDLERYDQRILNDIFSQNLRPIFISSEIHSLSVFLSLFWFGKYNAFKLVDGASVSEVYGNAEIESGSKRFKYSFPRHSAGPFGDDIHGEWLSAKEFLKLILVSRVGWKDVHATRIDQDHYRKVESTRWTRYSYRYLLTFFIFTEKVRLHSRLPSQIRRPLGKVKRWFLT